MPNEEIKSSNYQSMLMPHRLDESKSPSEYQFIIFFFNIQLPIYYSST